MAAREILTRPIGPPARRRLVGGQLVRFAAVGAASTAIQLGLYAFISADVGSQLANVVAWLVSTLIATEGHRRYSFRTAGTAFGTGHADHADHALSGATALAGLLLTSLTLAILGNPVGVTGTLAVLSVNAAFGVLRFVALRWWMTGERGDARSPRAQPVPPLALTTG